MQTKQDIEKLLTAAAVRPNRRLGQHFLIDMNLMTLLIEAAHLNQQDTVLEVGTGTGSLTQELAMRAGKVISIEYDAVLHRIAQAQLHKHDNITFFCTDVLENKNSIHPEILYALRLSQEELGGRILLVANLPYNVGSAVMANLITGPLTADQMYATVQKEVAERMAALPGQEEYGTLSILMAATGDVHIFRKLPASVFWPRPQVESAMVSFVRDDVKAGQIYDMDTFRQVISLFMGHRRKMLKACVKFADGSLEKVRHWGEVFDEAFVEPHRRAEELAAADYINIANLCWEQIR